MKLAVLQRAQETSPLQSAAYSTCHSFELTLLHTEGSLPTGRAPVVLASSTSWGLHCFQPSPSQLHTIYSWDLSVGTPTLTSIAQSQLFTKIPSILYFSCLKNQYHICDLAKLATTQPRAQFPQLYQLLGATLEDSFFPRQFFGGAGNSFSLGFFLLNKPESLQNEVTKEWDFAHKTPLLKFLFTSNNSNNDSCFLSTGIYSTVLKFPLPNKLAHHLQNQLHLSSQNTCRMQSDSSHSITLMAPASFLTVFLSPPPKPHEPDLQTSTTHISQHSCLSSFPL